MVLAVGGHLDGQVLTESFTGTTASGWVFAGTGYTPVLTAAEGIDTAGDGWLRLTSNGGNQATSAYYDTAFASAGATVYAAFEYATWGGNGADGITFFLFDGSTSFSVGANGGSLGYAQKSGTGADDHAGLAGGYIGVAIDEYGNFSNATEGRVGGIGFTPDSIAVRGSEASNYAYLGGSGTLPTSIDTPGVGTRPSVVNQVQILLNATNQLTVTLQQGGTSPQTILQMDLSAYERPETLKLGFTSGTGGLNNYHEIRNIAASTIGASLWSNSLGTSSWAANNNWDPTVTPGNGEDILFDNTHVATAQTIDTAANRSVRSITFDAPFDYTLNNNTLTFDNGGVAGFSGIAATQTHGSGNHTINSALALDNSIYVRNSNSGTLNLGGNIATNGHTVTFDGSGGTITASGAISGAGNVIKNDPGTLTLSGASTYSGGTALNNGRLNADSATALGTGTVTVNGGTLGSTNASTVANTVTLANSATFDGFRTTGTLTQSGGSYTLGLTDATLGNVNLSNDNTARTLTADVTGTSTITGVIANGGTGAGNLTKTGDGTLVLSGASTYTGTTTISEGTLTLGASNRLHNATDLVFGAGASLNLNGFSERVDNLTGGDGASINFGTPGGANTFLFDTYTAPSSGVLVINNWENGTDQLATTVNSQDVSTIYLSGYGVATYDGGTTTYDGSGTGYLLTSATVTIREWDGSSSANWDTSSNWTPANVPNSSSEIALFDDAGLGRTSVSLNANRTIGGLIFGENASSSYNVFSTNRDLTLQGTVPYIQQKSATTQTLAFDDLRLRGNTVVDITGAGDLVISADVVNYDATARSLIRDGTGAGKLILSGDANTYSGGTYINTGILQIQHSSALGTGTAHVADGGALELSNSGTTTNTIQLAGTGVAGGGALRNVAGANTLSGTLTETAATRITADTGTTLSLTGNLTGTNTATTFAGPGTINAARITTGTGAVTVESGTVNYTGANANTYTGVTTVSSGATLNLNKTAGTTAIGTGGLTVNSGTVSLQQSNQIADTATVTLTGTGTLDLAGNAETLNRLDTAAASTVALGSTGSLTLSAGSVTNSTLTGNLTGGASSALNVSGLSNVYVTKDNTGFIGTTNVQSGTLNLSTSEAVGSGAINVSAGGNLQVQGGLNLDNTVTLNGTGTGGNGALQNFAGSNTLSGSVVLGSDARVETNTGTLTISAPVTGSGHTLTVGGTANTVLTGTIGTGAGGLTKDESGTLTVSGNNTYTGATTVSGGTLIAAHDNALGTSASGTTVASGATLQLQNNITITGEALANSGTLRNQSGANAYTGTISGTGGVNVAGGQLTLSGNNTFSGDIIVSNGTTLVATADNALGTGGTTTVQNGGTLELQNNLYSDTETMINLAGTGNGGNGALLNTSGTNTLVSNITLNGATTIGSTGGTLQIGNPANPAWPVQGTIAMGANDLTFATTGGNIFLRETLTGTGDVYKTGSGTLTVKNGFNDGSTADFFIQDGTLILDTFNNENLGILGNITVGDGTGAAGSARFQQGELESGSGLSNNLISDSSNIIINADGYWDLQGYKEIVNNVTMNGGTIEAKNNSGTGDRLDLIGVLTAANATTSTIDGRLGMNNDTAKSIVVDAGSTLDINAVLSNGGFDKTGDGTLILSGANSFTGTAQISDGIVRVDNNSGLGATAGGTQVLSGAQLQLDHVTIGAESLSLAGTGHNADGTGALRALTGTTNSWGGNVSLTANAEIQTDASAALVINGGITGSGRTLTVDSIGTTTLNGINTFNTLEKNGAGTLTVTNTNTYATANVNAGTFALGASNILADTMDVHLGAAGTFNVGSYTDVIDDLTGSGTLTIASGGDLTIDKIGGSLSSGNPTGAFTGVLDVDGILTLNGGTIGAANGAGSTGTIELTANSTLNIAGNFTYGGTLELADNTTLNLVNNGTTFNVDTLRVTGDSVIDFAGVNVATLNIGTLEIDLGGTILATSWASFYDLWTATNFSGATLDERNATTAQITFSGFSADQTIWLTYDYGANEITVPEPSTYGAMFMGAAFAAYLWRRRRTRHP